MTQAVNQDLAGDQRSQRRRVSGYLSYVAGCVLAIAAVLSGFALFQADAGLVAGFVVGVVLLLLAILLLALAEGFLVPAVHEVCARDPRPPVVYLRPFGEDRALTYDVITTGETTTAVTAKAEDFLLALNAIGPLVSIAEPNRAARIGLHPHGVSRDFIGEGDWQARVREMLDQAGMVVLAIGDSPGIEWEIAQVRERVGPESLLLYLPPRPAGALTRRGREKKEAAIYAQFAPLVEQHFGVTMPPFSAATYLIGFDADGKAVMAPDAQHRGWAFSEHGRVAGTIRAQLEAVVARVRPGVDLRHYRLPGRTGLWARLALTLTLVAATTAFGLTGSPGDGAALRLLLQLLPGLALLAGWVLLARYFGRRWVWTIPLLLGLLLGADAALLLSLEFGWPERGELVGSAGYQALRSVLHAGYVASVLVLGLSLIGRRADPPAK